MENNQKRFFTAQDVSGYMGISISKAYKVIRSLNDELNKNGFLTVSGKVSRTFFEKKVCGEFSD